MMNKILMATTLVTGLICLSSPVLALDLREAYRLALTNDANFLAAQSAAAAAREAIPQARAGLLPTIGYSNNRSKNSAEQTSLTALGERKSEYDYTGISRSLSLRQALIRADRWIQQGQAAAQVASAEATLDKETQNLALRVSEAYFTVLLATERLNVIQAQKKAYAGQLQSAERFFVAGEGTRTDIDEARARHLLAAAQEIDAGSALMQAEKSLAAVIGQPVMAKELASIDERRMVYEKNDGKALEALLAQAEETNPELRALRHNFEAAQAEVNRNRAQHLPTLDLVASKSYSSSENNNTVGNTYKTDSIGLQLYVPIYSGGQVDSSVRQAVANLDKIRLQMEAARRQLSVEITKQYDAYFRGAEKLKAYEEARNAARQVLLSTRKGMLAGTRNTIDILNAEQQVANTEVELARARAEYSLASLRLTAAAGELGEKDIDRINAWLARGHE